MKIIEVAKDFTPYPGGRFIKDGSHSGEDFREKIIIPNLKEEQICFDMKDVRGFGSSFLEEAFGGLIRKGALEADDFKSKFQFKNILPSVQEEIFEYVNFAKKINNPKNGI